jgi:hypothetical protein
LIGRTGGGVYAFKPNSRGPRPTRNNSGKRAESAGPVEKKLRPLAASPPRA